MCLPGTEDWFPDAANHRWGYYSARMRSAIAMANRTGPAMEFSGTSFTTAVWEEPLGFSEGIPAPLPPVNIGHFASSVSIKIVARFCRLHRCGLVGSASWRSAAARVNDGGQRGQVAALLQCVQPLILMCYCLPGSTPIQPVWLCLCLAVSYLLSTLLQTLAPSTSFRSTLTATMRTRQ